MEISARGGTPVQRARPSECHEFPFEAERRRARRETVRVDGLGLAEAVFHQRVGQTATVEVFLEEQTVTATEMYCH